MEQKAQIELERASLIDLGKITYEAREWKLDLLVIGGYAARAYTSREHWRFSKDLDFIMMRQNLDKLRGFLQDLGYSFEITEFGVRGSRKFNGDKIDLHIAIDKVIDWSTGAKYFLEETSFRKSHVKIEPFFEENKDCIRMVDVAPIEDVLTMKLMTLRERDHYDAVGIIMDSGNKIDMNIFVKNCERGEVKEQIIKHLEDLIGDAKSGALQNMWKTFTGTQLQHKRVMEVMKELRGFHKTLVSQKEVK